jgi:hypothetical protein
MARRSAFITGAAQIKAGLATELRRGNLEERRDGGRAVLQKEKPYHFDVLANEIADAVLGAIANPVAS